MMAVSHVLPAQFSSPSAATLDEIKRRIVATAQPEKIILFGSNVGGQSNPDSDVDMLVIVRGPVHRRALAQEIYRSLHGILIPVDVVVATEQDVQQHGQEIGSILRPALREGKVIYERDR
jgi:predicted nucleotidyltransferase